ncbi:MAG: hypothetical protein HC769_35620 [Cyanobacteria bacterium CRU_2_1]|nr:hypothetical protein [Cyanobacteria bacterium CRU_2_1]
MKTSCVNHPPNETMLVLRRWQLDACDDNHCAATLLSFFIYWHDIRLEQSKKSDYQNEIAEAHGEKGKQDNSLLQFHSEAELINGVLGLFKRDSIRKALNLLQEKGYITVQRNPNTRYKFDKTRYFRLYPERLNQFIVERSSENRQSADSSKKQPINPLPLSKNQPRPSADQSPLATNEQAITEITSKTSTEISTETLNPIMSRETRDAIDFSSVKVEVVPDPAIANLSVAAKAGQSSLSIAQRIGQDSLFRSAAIPVEKRKTRRKIKSTPTQFPEQFNRWWEVYREFCLRVDCEAGKRTEAIAAWDILMGQSQSIYRQYSMAPSITSPTRLGSSSTRGRL